MKKHLSNLPDSSHCQRNKKKLFQSTAVVIKNKTKTKQEKEKKNGDISSSQMNYLEQLQMNNVSHHNSLQKWRGNVWATMSVKTQIWESSG